MWRACGGGGRTVKKEVKLNFAEACFCFYPPLKYKDVHILFRRKHSEGCVWSQEWQIPGGGNRKQALNHPGDGPQGLKGASNVNVVWTFPGVKILCIPDLNLTVRNIILLEHSITKIKFSWTLMSVVDVNIFRLFIHDLYVCQTHHSPPSNQPISMCWHNVGLDPDIFFVFI